MASLRLGSAGDFGCHILDPVFKALKLTAPLELTASAPALLPETWTDRAEVRYKFPATEFTTGPTINVTWYDAVDLKLPREKFTHLPADFKLPTNGSILIGEKGSILIPHWAPPTFFATDGSTPGGLPKLESVDHYVQFADACRGQAQTTSAFDYAGPLTETVLLGTVAIRVPEKLLVWNSETMRITNMPAVEQWLSKPYRNGWEPKWIA